MPPIWGEESRSSKTLAYNLEKSVKCKIKKKYLQKAKMSESEAAWIVINHIIIIILAIQMRKKKNYFTVDIYVSCAAVVLTWESQYIWVRTLHINAIFSFNESVLFVFVIVMWSFYLLPCTQQQNISICFKHKFNHQKKKLSFGNRNCSTLKICKLLPISTKLSQFSL